METSYKVLLYSSLSQGNMEGNIQTILMVWSSFGKPPAPMLKPASFVERSLVRLLISYVDQHAEVDDAQIAERCLAALTTGEYEWIVLHYVLTWPIANLYCEAQADHRRVCNVLPDDRLWLAKSAFNLAARKYKRWPTPIIIGLFEATIGVYSQHVEARLLLTLLRSMALQYSTGSSVMPIRSKSLLDRRWMLHINDVLYAITLKHCSMFRMHTNLWIWLGR